MATTWMALIWLKMFPKSCVLWYNSECVENKNKKMIKDLAPFAQLAHDYGFEIKENLTGDGLTISLSGMVFDIIPNADSGFKDFYIVQKLRKGINVVLVDLEDFLPTMQNMSLYYLLSERVDFEIAYNDALRIFKALKLTFEASEENKALLKGLIKIKDLGSYINDVSPEMRDAVIRLGENADIAQTSANNLA